MIWTQKQFNLDHAEPREYGEGDMYVLADNYTDEEAAKLINEFEEQLTGDLPTYGPEDIQDLPIVKGKNEDGEADWCVKQAADSKDIVAWAKGIVQ
jgi:hypothetical protein